MTAVRLKKELESRLAETAKRENKTKTELITEALESYLDVMDGSTTPYELGKDLFGLCGNNDKDGSIRYKERLRKVVGEKYAH